MATFLALCQKVASDAGTLSDSKPAAVTGQTGYEAKVVRFVQDAWRQIQNAHSSWLWMQSEFYGNTVASTQRYAYTAFTDRATAATITRFAEWIVDREGPDSGITLYDPAIGLSDEGVLRYNDWDYFYKTAMRGVQNEDKPARFTIAPDNKLVFSYTPDGIYTIKGRYRKDEQALAANGDIPECPARFHDAIVDAALMMLGTHDEAAPQMSVWQMRKSRNFSDLERDQLPRAKFSTGPLA
jgi:hypothetical protein